MENIELNVSEIKMETDSSSACYVPPNPPNEIIPESETLGPVNSATNECSLCGEANADGLMDMSENEEMLKRIKKHWNLSSELIKVTLGAICVECVCKLNVHSELKRTIMQRLTHLQEISQVEENIIIEQPSTSSDAAVVVLSIADEEVSPTASLETNEQVNDKKDKFSLEYQQTSESSSNFSVPQANNTGEVLPTAAESGAAVNNVKNSRKRHTQLECQYCGRTYCRKDYYASHIRRCQQAQATSLKDKSATSTNENTAERKISTKRVHTCSECELALPSLVKLRQHKRQQHMPAHRCTSCGKQFKTKHEYQTHNAACSGKKETKAKRINKMRQAKSRSRTVSHSGTPYSRNSSTKFKDVKVKSEDIDDNLTISDSMSTHRMHFTGDWVLNSSRSNSLSLFRDYNDDSNLDKVPRMDYTNEWVRTHSQTGNDTANFFNSKEVLDYVPITDRAYDLFLLSQLKMQFKMHDFTCLVPSCDYRTNTFTDILNHDYEKHWRKSWYYCPKCGDKFTSKVFLDYHLENQNSGTYICHKCTSAFSFQTELDRHHLLHQMIVNYKCDHCYLEFLDEYSLNLHMRQIEHEPNEKRSKITIDRSLTISNPVPKEEKPKPYEYTVRIMELNTTGLPNRRSTAWPQHKPFDRQVEHCDFENQQTSNCVRCK